jgi:hypothetical protein
VEKGSSFAGFGCVSEESVDSGSENLVETCRKKGALEPFGGSGLCGSFLFGGAFDDGVPCGVGECLTDFKEIVSKR